MSCHVNNCCYLHVECYGNPRCFHELFISPTLHFQFYVLTFLSLSILGVIGDSNTKCHNATAPSKSGTGGTVSSSCVSDSQCLYEKCRNNVCVAPALACPTNIPGKRFLSYTFSLLLFTFRPLDSVRYYLCIETVSVRTER